MHLLSLGYLFPPLLNIPSSATKEGSSPYLKEVERRKKKLFQNDWHIPMHLNNALKNKKKKLQGKNNDVEWFLQD